MKRALRAAVLIMVLAAFFTTPCNMAFHAAGDTSAKPVTLILQWMPQAQFAGYYVALDKGIYREHGLDVRIIRGGPDRDGVEYLEKGDADFAIMFLSGALSGRDRDVPLVHLGQIVNQSNLMLVGWKEKGIKDARSLNGRKVSLWGGAFQADFLSFFTAKDVQPQTIPQYYSVNLFLAKGVDVCSAMYYNEYHMLFQAGVDESELTAFFMKDFGFGFPEDGIYCLEHTLRTRPAESASFAAASLAGWKYAAEHREEALDIVMKYVQEAQLPTNRAHMRWMLEKILPTIIPGEEASWELGRLSREDYRRTVEILKQHELIAGAPSYEIFRGEGIANVQ